MIWMLEIEERIVFYFAFKIRKRIQIFIHTRIHTQLTHIHTKTRAHTQVHAYKDRTIHAYKGTHTQTYMHTQKRMHIHRHRFRH